MSVEHLTKDIFENKVQNMGETALIDFWATWCGPCQMLGPVIEELSEELAGKILVGKVNIDENQELASQYGVMSIPTIILFKGGKETGRLVGLQSKQALLQFVNKA